MPPRRSARGTGANINDNLKTNVAGLAELLTQIAANLNAGRANNEEGRSLTWWNTQVQTRGRDAKNGLTWETFKDKYTANFHELAKMLPHMVSMEEKKINRYIWGLVPEIRRMITSSNATTLQTAVGLAYRLINDVIRSSEMPKRNDNERKRHNDQERKQDQKEQIKRRQVTRNYRVATHEQRPYNGPQPKCTKCNLHHVGDFLRCNNYRQMGHFSKVCKNKEENGNNGRRSSCYECMSLDYLQNVSLRLNRVPNNNKKNARNPRAPARGRVYAIGAEEAVQNQIMMTAHVVEKDRKVKSIRDIPVVKNYLEVFPEDLPGPPLKAKHEQHLNTILSLLQDEKLYAKFSKFEFWLREVQFLGHVVNVKGIHVDPVKIKAIKKWEAPRTLTKICQFLGLAVYYQSFIKDFLKIAKPLTKLTQKTKKFVWEKEQEEAF
nr:hypothetical protein [Tanacetum cinerariifolium]